MWDKISVRQYSYVRAEAGVEVETKASADRAAIGATPSFKSCFAAVLVEGRDIVTLLGGRVEGGIAE